MLCKSRFEKEVGLLQQAPHRFDLSASRQFILTEKESIMARSKISVLTLLVFLLSFFLVGSAVAATPKPPAIACFKWDTMGFATMISTKVATKTIQTATSSVKFYSVIGETLPIGGSGFPVVGSGHMNGDVFHFSFSGSIGNAASFYTLTAEGKWNTSTASGTISYRIVGLEINKHGHHALISIPCTDPAVAQPYSTDSNPSVLFGAK
jgi:hypothetical protein